MKALATLLLGAALAFASTSCASSGRNDHVASDRVRTSYTDDASNPQTPTPNIGWTVGSSAAESQ